MRIVVTGATGNVGSAVVQALSREPAVTEILGLARRVPSHHVPKTDWVAADIRDADLTRLFRGAEAVIHLAWLIQPSRDRQLTAAVNVGGSERVFAAAAAAHVPTLVHASSVGTYAPHPGGEPVDESWPATGIPSSFYSRDKAACERFLDTYAAENPNVRVVRLRPSLIFQRPAAQEIRRLFAGPFVPGSLLGRLPVAPAITGVRVQAVHARDVADAYRRAVLDDSARGAYNIAAEPPLDGRAIARAIGLLPVPVPARIARAAATATWRARIQPTPPGWLDLATHGPLLDTTRARRELGWAPTMDGRAVLEELLEGLRTGSGGPTPPLRAKAGGRLRGREIRTGVGARST